VSCTRSCARTAVPTARVAATTVINIAFIVFSPWLDGTARKEFGGRSVVDPCKSRRTIFLGPHRFASTLARGES
jgi:hypothetical protein